MTSPPLDLFDLGPVGTVYLVTFHDGSTARALVTPRMFSVGSRDWRDGLCPDETDPAWQRVPSFVQEVIFCLLHEGEDWEGQTSDVLDDGSDGPEWTWKITRAPQETK